MPIAYKVLGQSNPTANTLTTVYTVPSATQAVVSTVTICNRSATATTFRLAVRQAGAAIDDKQYVNYDTTVPGNDTVALTLGLSLGNTDIISANVRNATVAISVFGSEIT